MSEEIKIDELISAIENVPEVNAEEQEAIKRNTAYALPNSPAEHGMPADAVKLAFWRGIVGDSNSAVAFLNRLADKLNIDLGKLREVLSALVDVDTALGERIDSEATERKSADTALGERIDSEATERESADSALSKRLDSIPDASTTKRGYMTPEQVNGLEMLLALFEDDADTVINTIKEVLKAFEEAPEGVNIAKILDSKLPTAHANDEHAHAALFSLFDEKILAEKTERVAADSALSKRLDSIPDASTTKRGYMTPEQVKLLKNLAALHVAEDFLTDASVAYRKVVPVRALPYATLGKIGGNVKIQSSNMLAAYGSLRGGVFKGIYSTISVDESDPTRITVTAAPPTEYDPNDDPPRAEAYAEIGVMALPEGRYTLHGVPSGLGISVNVTGPDTFIDEGDGVTFDHSYGDEKLILCVSCSTTQSFSVSFKIELNEGDTAYATTTTCVTAPVTEVVSGNSNLFDIDNPRLVGITTGTITANSPVISDGVIYSGGVHGGSRGAGLLVDVKNIDTIYISFNYAYDSSVNRYAAMLVDFFDEIDDDIYNPEREDSFAFSNAEGYVSRAVDVSGYDFVSLMFCSTVKSGIAITDLMVSVEDVPYEPYGVLDTYTIPAEIRALKGYGEGNPYNPAEVNYIDIEARKFVAYGYMDEPDADYPDVKVWVPYDAPVETDISAYLPEDNFIRVARGGSLTFVNEHEVAVPSTVTYQQEVGE